VVLPVNWLHLQQVNVRVTDREQCVGVWIRGRRVGPASVSLWPHTGRLPHRDDEPVRSAELLMAGSDDELIQHTVYIFVITNGFNCA